MYGAALALTVSGYRPLQSSFLDPLFNVGGALRFFLPDDEVAVLGLPLLPNADVGVLGLPHLLRDLPVPLPDVSDVLISGIVVPLISPI